MLFSLLNNELNEEDYCNENNIRIIYKKLPKKIYGFIHKYRGINIVIINWNLSKEKKMKTILHELAHLELHHLDNEKELLEFSIENLEDEADRYIKELYIIKEESNFD